MIELLTPPVAADPAAPVIPGAVVGDALPDFAALLGGAAPAVPGLPVAVGEGAAPAIKGGAAAITPAIKVDAAAVTPELDAPVPAAPVIETPVADVEPVKLPTLPVGFVAQKLAEPAKPVVADGREETPAAPADPKLVLANAVTPKPQEAKAAKPEQKRPALLARDGDDTPDAEGEEAPQPIPAPILDTPPAAPAPVAIPLAVQPPVDTMARRQLIMRTREATTAPVTEAALRDPAITRDPALATPSTPDLAAPQSVAPERTTGEPTPALATPQPADARPAPDAPIFADTLAIAQPAAPQPQPLPAAAPITSTAVVLDDLMVAGAADSAWVDRLATDITTLASGDAREATLKLTPRALGDMAIKLEVEGDHARVHFTVETPQTLSLMTDGAPRLAQIVEANGFKLDGATVDLSQRQGGRDASGQQQQSQSHHDQSRGQQPRVAAELAARVARTRINTATERYA